MTTCSWSSPDVSAALRSRLSRRLPAALLALALTGLGLAPYPAGAASHGPGIDVVRSALRTLGPRATLARYFPCDRHQGTGYAAVATGSAAWLALAERLIADADACHAEGLRDALGRAMQRAPRQVLRLVGKTERLSAEAICLPSISDEPPPAAQRAALARSRRAIEAVRQAELQPQRQACLRFIADVGTAMAERAETPDGSPVR